MNKIIQKPEKSVLIVKFFIFLWILICNAITQIFSAQFEAIGVATWTIFIVNILFFLMEEEGYKERFIKCFGGVIIGMLALGLFCVVYTLLLTAGVDRVLAVMLPLAVVLFCIIILNSYIPYLFNNVAFAYFTIGLIDATTSFSHLLTYTLGGIFGNIIVNGGALLIMNLVIARLTKKAQSK